MDKTYKYMYVYKSILYTYDTKKYFKKIVKEILFLIHLVGTLTKSTVYTVRFQI